MTQISKETSLSWLIKTYFSDPEKYITLGKGELLLEQGQKNSRLFLVRKGKLQGYVEDESGRREETLQVGRNSFLGVYSFFSKTFQSIATIEALSNCELAYIDRNQLVVPTENATSLEKQFMQVAIRDLMMRQQRILEIGIEKEQAVQRLVENQRLASLGQMAAGIAHELNNAVAVLYRNTNWLVDQFNQRWADPRESAIFESGLLRGRFLSSSEVRKRKKQLMAGHGLDEHGAGLIAQTGIPDDLLSQISEDWKKEVDNIFSIWELGATFNDMLIAAEQSTHVVRSVKTLGEQNKQREPNLDINESINNSLALLRHRVKNLDLNLELNPLPDIHGNMGDFVQIWTNLIKNACEAMAANGDKKPGLAIRSRYTNARILIIVEDNGPGIPKDIIPRIFQPNVTTKVSGLSFGLGLGLTIVQRLITEYNGTIKVDSSDKGTKFIIQIPIGGTHG